MMQEVRLAYASSVEIKVTKKGKINLGAAKGKHKACQPDSRNGATFNLSSKSQGNYNNDMADYLTF